MNRRFLLLASALVLAGAPLSAGHAAANPLRPTWVAPEPLNGRVQRVQDTQVRPVREIIDSVRRQIGGEFVAMRRLERDGDPPIYVLLWRFPNEEHREIRVNAVTGQVLSR